MRRSLARCRRADPAPPALAGAFSILSLRLNFSAQSPA
jgi:hypothetical protein